MRPSCHRIATLVLIGVAAATTELSAQQSGGANQPRPVPADSPMWSHMRKTAGDPGSASSTRQKSLSVEDKARLDDLNERAIALLRKNEIMQARELWRAMLALDPKDVRARAFLESTDAEARASVGTVLSAQERRAREEAIRELLDSPVTIQTERPTTLAEFMRLLSFSTKSELEYSIAEGGDIQVLGDFIDRPLRDVLDAILHPAGYTWEINEKKIITIHADLVSRTFRLNSEQMAKTRSLLDSGTLQQIIWGRAEPPTPKSELTLDERQRVLLAVGSRIQLQKLGDFLTTMQAASPADIETRTYKIQERDGPKVRALVNALIADDRHAALQSERKLYIDGSDLIVRDTPANLKKIEELMLDETFVKQMRGETLDIANFSLIPRGLERENSDAVRVFTQRVVESVQTFLYAAEGQDAARRAGRRLWFDEASLQLTIVDTPTNIRRVGEYLNSLPQLSRGTRQAVIKLDHGVAADVAAQVATVLKLQPPAGAPGGAAEETVRLLRRGEEFTFGDLRIRLIRVDGGDVNDRFDDQAQLQLVSGTNTNQITLTELQTQFFENYEITAEDVLPSGGGGGGGRGGGGTTARQGEGTVELHVRRIAPLR